MGRTFVAPGLITVTGSTPFDQWVFYVHSTGDGKLYAWKYYSGTDVAARGSITFTGSLQNGNAYLWGCIGSDSSSLVGSGSLMCPDGGYVRVWDVEGATIYESAPTDPPAGGMMYSSGKVYWFDNPTATSMTLQSANTDLTSVATVRTITIPSGATVGGLYGHNGTAAFIQVLSGGTLYRYRVPFSGAAESSSDITAQPNQLSSVGLPGPGGVMVYLNSSYQLCSITDSASATPTNAWSALTVSASGTGSLSVSSDLTKAQLSGVSLGGGSYGCIRDATSGTVTSPVDYSFAGGASDNGVLSAAAGNYFYAG